MRVKICGLTNSRDLKMAVEAGADALGFVINAPKSPRNLTLPEAKQLIRRVPPFIATVAVTVFSNEQTLRDISRELEPDYLQIHGGATQCILELRERVNGASVIRAVNMLEPPSIEELTLASGFDAVILDSITQEGYGGTGARLDWHEAIRVKEKLLSTPIILAGGLNPENVREAVETVHPYAVDVSSGVETAPGQKEALQVRKFIAEAKGIS